MIEFLLLGLMLGSIPLIVWYLHVKFKITIDQCNIIKAEINETLSKLTEIHNNAAKTQIAMAQQIDKLQSEVAVLKANSQRKSISL